MRNRTVLLALAALGLAFAPACGDDEGDPAETGTTTTTAPAEETTTTTEAAAAAEVTTIDVTAIDYGYEIDGPPRRWSPGSSRSI